MSDGPGSSPFSDNGPIGGPAPDDGRQRQITLIDPSGRNRLPGFSDTVWECLARGAGLAGCMNHPQVTVAHFFAAMALVPAATSHLASRGSIPDRVWRAAIQALTDMDRAHGQLGRPVPLAGELDAIIREAQASARALDHDQASIDDVLAAVLKVAHETEARRLMRGDMRRNVADEVSEQMRVLSYRLTDRFDELERAVREQIRVAEEERHLAVVLPPESPMPAFEPVEVEEPAPKRGWFARLFGR